MAIRSNQEYNEIRRDLEARNLYTPENPYTINNNNLVKAINSIAGLIPGKSIDITNTVIGRAFLQNQTPIMTIGFQQYAKHLAQSVTSYGISDVLPQVSVKGKLFGKNKSPLKVLVTKKEDYRITRDETKTTVGRILQDITNQSPRLSSSIFTGRGNLAPFDKFPNQFDYIRNTGKGQLNEYYSSISKNLYVQTSEDFITVAEREGYKINKVTVPLLDKIFYPNDDFAAFPNAQEATDDVRSEIVIFRESQNEQRVSEYGSNITTLAMGKTNKYDVQDIAQNLPNQELSIDVEINDDTYGFSSENLDNQIVWGRTDDFRKFGVRSGALLYTKGLLQARGSRGYFDQTKKKFTTPNGKLSYNGSPLTREINGQVNRVRQHTIEDPYNTYAKAIRFNGNNLYSAPTASVINNTVIPKIHPIVKSSKEIDNKNLMFSIENLAYILNDAGYLGDTLGTKVPKSEVGPNRGRLMWFVPYDVEVNETAAAKYETTQFIGRSEPIYSYQSSERSARLSFKLIIDYPPQVHGMSHSDAAKFFAFGGVAPDTLKNIDIDKERAELVRLRNELAAIQPRVELFRPTDLISGEIATFYFNNDEDSIEDDMGIGYEDGIQVLDEEDFGLNNSFESKIENGVTILTNDVGDGVAFRYYDLIFIGSASKLYNNKNKEAEYNRALGERRATSLKNYFEKKFIEFYGTGFERNGIKVQVLTKGSSEGSDIGATREGIPLKEVKKERKAWVEFRQNSFVNTKEVGLTPDQENQKKKLEEEIQKKEELLAVATKVQNDERIFNEFKRTDRVMRGFESMKKYTLSPVFHSQTPEDFHRRLTFLHQCTRQGNSVINKSTADVGIETATNSVFGRPPICVLRLGDMFHSKVIIETVEFDFSESIWDVNPEGMGMQFMIADITMSLKIIGGQSLKTAIDVIQNAESFNYYANSTYYNNDVYSSARKVEDAQVTDSETLKNARGEARFGVNTDGSFGTLTKEQINTINNSLNFIP